MRFLSTSLRRRRGRLPEFSHNRDKRQAAVQVEDLDELAITDLEPLHVLAFVTVNFFQTICHHFLHYLATCLHLVSFVLWSQPVYVLKEFFVLLFDLMLCVLHLLSQTNT